MPAEAPVDCTLCPRLVGYRAENAAAHPDWFNGAVPSFGGDDAWLLIVGLAPGVTGANRTGRPFTGDFAGDLLYGTLIKTGLADGSYNASPDDGLRLRGAMITNAVRCVPPKNKPTGAEIAACRPFLRARIGALPNLRCIIALGRIAHDSVVTAFGLRPAHFPFGHNKGHDLPAPDDLAASPPSIRLCDSYHCSRYNTNTGRLTEDMFQAVFNSALQHKPGS